MLDNILTFAVAFGYMLLVATIAIGVVWAIAVFDEWFEEQLWK